MADQGGISLDEFKARLPLVEIVARRVRLTRHGHEHVGLCPFHREKTPSFTVSEAKGFYHCFGCQQHGNAIDFVMASEGLEFAEAVARLAELFGLPLPWRAGSRAPAPDQTLLAANEAAARWFAGRLGTASGGEALSYLARRGLDRATVERFGLGYAPPGRTMLKDALLAEGYAEAQLVAAGLLVRPEDDAPYDRFRHRVMFPIHDRRGRVIAFGGRALGDARAKYLNSPETALFHKGEVLYGLALARDAVRARGTVIVAEGYMDVIALAQAGLDHAVAPLGTAITEAQLGLLWQLADEPVVCLDGDDAGLRAAARLIERALPLLKPGKSLRFALLPAGHDPDSTLRAWGRESLTARLDEAMGLADFLWSVETRGINMASVERRAALDRRLRDLAGRIADRDLGRRFLEAMVERMRAAFAPAEAGRRTARSPLARPGGHGVGAARLRSARLADPEAAAAQDLLGPILVHPELLSEVEEELAAEEFAHAELEELRRGIISWYGEHGDLDLDDLRSHLTEIGFASLVNRLAAVGPLTAWYCGPGADRAEVLDGWRARLAQHRHLCQRRAVGDAVADAIRGVSVEEARTQTLAFDRLINRAGRERSR
ncbi:MAG TPA: DNA primase [Geminicoccaceae bacterium]|nr:DNA primase [Geminicoccaceae bacterium]